MPLTGGVKMKDINHQNMLNSIINFKYLNMNFIKKGIFFLFAATVLVACSDDDDPVVVDPGTDPVVSNHPLAGTSWSIAAEAGALGCGPNPNEIVWWNLSAEDVTTRACLLDDTYTFNADNTFVQDMQDSSWLETWQEGVTEEACGAPVTPHNGSNAATWSADTSTITIVGDGAFLGLSKVHNLGQDGNAADDTIIYDYTLDGDTLEIIIQGWNGNPQGEDTWYYKFTKN
jgi:hypothetical protein